MCEKALSRIIPCKTQWEHFRACAFTFLLFPTKQNVSFPKTELYNFYELLGTAALTKYLVRLNYAHTKCSASATPYIYNGVNDDDKGFTFLSALITNKRLKPCCTTDNRATNERLFLSRLTSTNQSQHDKSIYI